MQSSSKLVVWGIFNQAVCYSPSALEYQVSPLHMPLGVQVKHPQCRAWCSSSVALLGGHFLPGPKQPAGLLCCLVFGQLEKRPPSWRPDTCPSQNQSIQLHVQPVPQDLFRLLMCPPLAQLSHPHSFLTSSHPTMDVASIQTYLIPQTPAILALSTYRILTTESLSVKYLVYQLKVNKNISSYFWLCSYKKLSCAPTRCLAPWQV